MYDEREDLIRVTTKGTAETEFVGATYSASVATSGGTGPEAKSKCQPIIEALRTAILAHAEKAKIDTGRMKTTFGVDVERHRQTGEFSGYRATYTISFQGKNVKAGPEVHDALTSIEGVQSPTPVFNVTDTVEVHTAAFHDAAAKAQAKFAGQCAALNLNPGHFRVVTWSVQEERPTGKTLSFRDGGDPESVGLEPGKASMDLTVSFSYGKKPQAEIDAGPESVPESVPVAVVRTTKSPPAE